ncbi:galactoside 2-alpha-L-fucosyltransferase-like [Coffea eugenioides]|uniref:galactoside 2-alpha-L-fucosyltransferase-like n=1 Tax=Coffea eugenioides TaxID=49369 RepID=UPI000F605F52|nr:galactoside 2-alpha-L-fucosyltransferase-like [Coffea eugenioides]
MTSHTVYSRVPAGAICVNNPIKVLGIFVLFFMALFALLSAFKGVPSSYSLWSLDSTSTSQNDDALGVNSSQSVEVPKDKLLAGLLPEGLDENSCLSRYQLVMYQKHQMRRPSSHLIHRLRKYESLHKKCGPFTESYNRTLEYMKLGKYTNSTDCKYVVWTAIHGLGNRLLTLASAFLYALLTNRVLLIDPGAKIADLLCEPFPEVSWSLPSNFPVTSRQFNAFRKNSPQSYGNMLKNNILGNSTSTLPPYVYLNLVGGYNDYDQLFFCDEHQSILQKVTWLIIKSDIYFVPSLFLIPSFEQQLSNLFPEKELVFHYLGRYLFHPTNSVWGLITRNYDTYLARADERIGIQIRIFDWRNHGPYVLDQILACVRKEHLLPRINQSKSIFIPSDDQKPKTKAVLMTSLTSWYSEQIRNMYLQHPTVTGEVIQVHQPSQEKYQQTGKQMHDRKALAEIYLLSFSDKLVTSACSTFGYVAQSLGGLKPWILYRPEKLKAPDPPCQRAVSLEPCFHSPPSYDCKRKKGIDTGKLVPHVQHCEDRKKGIKLVDRNEDL